MSSFMISLEPAQMRVTRIWAGSNEIMKELIGRDLGF